MVAEDTPYGRLTAAADPTGAWLVQARRPERGHAGKGLVEVKPRRARRRPTRIIGVGCRITATQRPGRRRQGAAGS
jgi:hypothetical protein